MKKLHFLFLLVGGLMLLGCPRGIDFGEYQDITKYVSLTVTAVPSYGGTVTPSHGQAFYELGTVVTLAANPASGYVFVQWEGDATGSENPTTIALNGEKSVKAVFTWRGLTVYVRPFLAGTVTLSPDLTLYQPGTVVTLTANPAFGYVFVQWEEGATGSENPTTITATNEGKYVCAVFGSNNNKLNVEVSTGGSVARSPNQTQYEYGTVVTLMANPSSDYQFVRWEGDATGSDNPTTIVMTSDKTVQAIFTPTKPFIQLSSDHISGSFWIGVGVPSPVLIDITNGGAGILSGLDHDNHAYAGSDFFSTLSSSTAPATLTVTITDSFLEEILALPEGWSIQSYITITSAVAMNNPQKIYVSGTHIAEPIPDPGKVICAELHRQGLMDEAIWKADEAFGRYLRKNQIDVLMGYQLWALPVVKWMQKSKTVTRAVAFVATPWSYEMAYRMGASDKGSLAGKMLMDVGVPVCRAVGRVAIWAGYAAPPNSVLVSESY